MDNINQIQPTDGGHEQEFNLLMQHRHTELNELIAKGIQPLHIILILITTQLITKNNFEHWKIKMSKLPEEL